ncbi:uncharacterized protein [Rutidosis leptorrhynchoides]|uniref:uncharacterized protein n=1 Tax=Rutidosis leptorrhynchoides TaxID=125765 RepID=UPI003A994A36
MGRGKSKTKKSSSIAHHEDGSGEEEKLPVKRRGRPTKAQKEEYEHEKMNENEETKLEAPLEIGNKRKQPLLQTEENVDLIKDDDGVGPTKNDQELTKNVGFRHNGSRRKNKPRRAAEVGVSLCEVCSWLVLRS